MPKISRPLEGRRIRSTIMYANPTNQLLAVAGYLARKENDPDIKRRR